MALRATNARRSTEAIIDTTIMTDWSTAGCVGAATGGMLEDGRYPYEIGSNEVVNTGLSTGLFRSTGAAWPGGLAAGAGAKLGPETLGRRKVGAPTGGEEPGPMGAPSGGEVPAAGDANQVFVRLREE